MKVYRYMSHAEFMKLMTGNPLHNPKKRHFSHTNSCGFCFLAETTNFNTRNTWGEWKNYEYTPEDCAAFLEGIVSEDVLVEFEVQDPCLLHQGFGIYQNPVSIMYDETIRISEYSCHAYDKTVLRPMRFKLGDSREYCTRWGRRPWIQISAK